MFQRQSTNDRRGIFRMVIGATSVLMITEQVDPAQANHLINKIGDIAESNKAFLKAQKCLDDNSNTMNHSLTVLQRNSNNITSAPRLHPLVEWVLEQSPQIQRN
jgi:hypothetical protein